ncbi:histidine kinase [Nocardioides daphniae]|uniref:histidine kinase n=1 Tax=Nocardioides daphniae TaxID=402297 RepID=UPI0019310229|nr:histidine kinase dimerization/phosphoacceptor domain-containing protein [Nocardioides daphniae]
MARLRDSLAGARLAERRLIRREIHDGLGPSLAGLRFGVQGVQNLLRTDPEAAARLLDALQAELGERVDTVRELSHTCSHRCSTSSAWGPPWRSWPTAAATTGSTSTSRSPGSTRAVSCRRGSP